MARMSPASRSSFYWGIRMMPKESREAVGAVYAFCRAADDDVDLDHAKGKEAIARWREEVASCYAGFPRHPAMKALHPVVRTCKLKREYFDKILDGMEMDVARKRYAGMEELLAYCDCVAGAVGLLVLQVLGLHDNPRAQEYSRNLSHGLQLTNILRDIRADADIGRVYFPRDAMEAYGYTEAELKKGAATVPFFKLARFMAKKAEDGFAKAENALDPDLRKRLAGPEVMRATYRALLHKIMKAVDLSLDGTPPRLSAFERVLIAGISWLSNR